MIFVGIGVLAYKGIDNLWKTFEDMNVVESISSIPIWIAFSLGILNGLHLIIASPLLYQVFTLFYHFQFRTVIALQKESCSLNSLWLNRNKSIVG